ncbi:MAG: AAA family ATPase [Pseudomonadota bacterium]
MILHFNGFPGVGKLTIARELAKLIDAKVLDNHSVYNVALALTEFKSQAYYETLRAVRAIAYERVMDLPPSVPVIITNAHSPDSAWGNENWDSVIKLAKNRGSTLFIVVLECAPDENAQRIQHPDRDARRKPRDPNMFKGNAQGLELLDRDGDHLLHLDVTSMTATEAAGFIFKWVKNLSTKYTIT